jgi:hypothetical protein
MGEGRVERRLIATLATAVARYSRLMSAILVSAITLFPAVAVAQSAGVDCTAFYRYPSGAWAVIHPTVIVFGDQSLLINMSEVCCFRSETYNLIVDGVNIINIVKKACSRTNQ